MLPNIHLFIAHWHRQPSQARPGFRRLLGLNHSGSNVSSFERRGRMAASGLWALVCGAQGSRKAEDTFGLAWRKASFGLALEEPERGHGGLFIFWLGVGRVFDLGRKGAQCAQAGHRRQRLWPHLECIGAMGCRSFLLAMLRPCAFGQGLQSRVLSRGLMTLGV